MNIADVSPSPVALSLARLPEVQSRVGLSAPTIWRMRRAGTFPQPVQISPGLVGWVRTEIDQWVADRIADRDAKVGR